MKSMGRRLDLYNKMCRRPDFQSQKMHHRQDLSGEMRRRLDFDFDEVQMGTLSY